MTFLSSVCRVKHFLKKIWDYVAAWQNRGFIIITFLGIFALVVFREILHMKFEKILCSWCIYIAFYTNSYQLFTILQKKR